MCRASKGEKKNLICYTFRWEWLKSEQTVREKVTLTSIPNRNIANSGELCVCACVFLCVWLNENQTSATRRNSGETTDSLSSLFHVIFTFHTPVFYTAIHRKSQWTQKQSCMETQQARTWKHAVKMRRRNAKLQLCGIPVSQLK